MQGPTVHVKRNRKSGELIVQPCARHFGVPQQFGAPTILPANAGDDDVLRAVLDNLSKTESQKYDLTLAPKYSGEEQRRILKEEQSMIVQQTEAGYELMPMKRMRNSFGSIEEMTRTVPPEEFEVHGGKLIRELFLQIP